MRHTTRQILIVVLLVSLFLFTVAAREPEGARTKAYDREEIKPFVMRYVRIYGKPYAEVSGWRYDANEEYVFLYWFIDEVDYYISIMKTDEGWVETYNSFKLMEI